MTDRRRRLTRRERALAATKQKDRTRRLRVGGIAAVALLALATLWWVSNRPRTVPGEIPAGADRAAWGPANAPVVIEEWSDFR
jgi:hypothetical protein